ncbi:MAG: pyrroloquinoline quinone biosynthesis peptide chaperone PqqD, partial [Bdellovibrionia bacterium]
WSILGTGLEMGIYNKFPRLAVGCRRGVGSIILFPEGVIQLNATGAEIIQLCDGKKTVREIIQSLQNTQPKDLAFLIEKETVEFLNRLSHKCILKLN